MVSVSSGTQISTTDTGVPITGQSIQAGGSGIIGWLSQIYKALTTAFTGSFTPGQGATLTTGQVTITTAATLLKAANANRYGIVFDNSDAAINMYMGATSGVTTSTGKKLPAGANFSFDAYSGAIYLIAASGSPVATYAEEAV